MESFADGSGRHEPALGQEAHSGLVGYEFMDLVLQVNACGRVIPEAPVWFAFGEAGLERRWVGQKFQSVGKDPDFCAMREAGAKKERGARLVEEAGGENGVCAKDDVGNGR